MKKLLLLGMPVWQAQVARFLKVNNTKRWMLFAVCCVLMNVGAWGDSNGTFGTNSTWSIEGATMTVTYNTASDYPVWTLSGADMSSVSKVVIITGSGVTLNVTPNGGGTQGDEGFKLFYGKILDLSDASMTKATTTDWQGNITEIYLPIDDNNNQQFYNVVVPREYASLPSNLKIKGTYGKSYSTNLYSIEGNTVTARLNNTSNLINISNISSTAASLKLVGEVNAIDLSSIAAGMSIDLSEVTGGSGTITVPSDVTVLCSNEEVKARVSPSTNVVIGSHSIECTGGNVASAISSNPIDVTSITVTSGSLTSEDVTAINDLATLTTLDISAATATGAQVGSLLEDSKATSITLGASNITKLQAEDVDGYTINMSKITDGVTAASLASGMKGDNYIIDGTTLIVTGEMTTDRIAKINSILSANPSITSVDFSYVTNTSGVCAITGGSGEGQLSTQATMVNLPSNGTVTYSGSAAVLSDGALVLNVGSGQTLQSVVEANAVAVKLATNIKITGKLANSDLAYLETLCGNGDYNRTENGAVQVQSVDLSEVTGITSYESLNKGSVYGGASLLLPYLSGVEDLDVAGTNVYWIKDNTLYGKIATASKLSWGGALVNDDTKILKLIQGTNMSSSIGSALDDFVGISLVDLSEMPSDKLNQSELAALTNIETVVAPNGTSKLVVTGTLTNSALEVISNLSDLTSIDFSGVTSVASDIDWSKLTGPSSVEYVMMPSGQESAVDDLDTSHLTSLKAAGAYTGTVGYAHIYNNVEGESGALPTLNTTFSDVFKQTGITKLVATGTLAANDMNFVNVTTANLIDLSGATADPDVAAANLKTNGTWDGVEVNIIAPNGTADADLSKFLGSEPYKVSTVYAHNGTKLSAYFHKTGMVNSNGLSSEMVGDATSVTVLGDFINSGATSTNLETLVNNAASSITSIKISPSSVDSNNMTALSLANTNISSLNLSNFNADNCVVNISGCTNLQEANFTGANVKSINATNMSHLTSLNVTDTEPNFPTLDKENSVGTVDVTGTYTNTGFQIVADAEFNKERVIPSEAQEKVSQTGSSYKLSDCTMTFVDKNTTTTSEEHPLGIGDQIYWDGSKTNTNGMATINVSAGGLKAILDELAEDGYGKDAHHFNKVKINGTLNALDLEQLANINTDCLDLSGVTFVDGSGNEDYSIFTSTSAKSSYVKDLVLPATATRENIVNATALGGFSNLYAAVAVGTRADGKAVLNAYVKKEGALQSALVHVDGYGISADYTDYIYRTVNADNFRELVISGNLNAFDISGNATLQDGHIVYSTEPTEESDGVGTLAGSTGYHALNGMNNLESIDLKDASFANINDMTLSKMFIGTNLQNVVIPQTASVTALPRDFLNISNKKITKICIPYNIKSIGTRSFYGLIELATVTTTDSDGEEYGYIYDNSAADNGNRTTDLSRVSKTVTLPAALELLESYTFSVGLFKHVYVENPIAPECHVNAFPTITYVANNTIEESGGIVSAESYKKGSEYCAVLHFPAECSNNGEAINYTDVTRDYSIASEERDGRGNIIMYPTQAEMNRAFVEGTTGYLWNAISTVRNNNGGNLDFLSPSRAELQYETSKTVAEYEATIKEFVINETYNGYSTSFDDKYRGWHQFILTSYSPMGDEPEYTYNFGTIYDNEWWTMCYQFPLTKAELKKYFGSDAGDPKVCQLVGVERKVGEHIRLKFGEDLYAANDGTDYVTLAGVPYMIKPYLADGPTKPDESDPNYEKAYAAYLVAKQEYADSRILHAPISVAENVRFAPKTTAEMQALLTEGVVTVTKDAGQVTVIGDETKNGSTESYTFVGTFWRWALPRYCYFLGWYAAGEPHVRYFYHDSEANINEPNWNTCTAIICPTWNSSAGFYTPTDNFKLETVHWVIGDDGESFCSDDSYTDGEATKPYAKEHNVLMDFDVDEGLSSINTVHMGGVTKTFVSGKIYNVNGQLVSGNGETEHLSKGVYIVGGKKFVVK